MLVLRPTCERCSKPLPPNARDAMICTFECTFCESCALSFLRNVCPNCGGNFQHRPIRPKAKLETRPASTERVTAEVDASAHRALFDRYGALPPEER